MDLDTSKFQHRQKNCKYWAMCLFHVSNTKFCTIVLLMGVLQIVLWFFAGVLRCMIWAVEYAGEIKYAHKI